MTGTTLGAGVSGRVIGVDNGVGISTVGSMGGNGKIVKRG